MGMNTLSRGSEWLRWDPHIHTPGTMHEDRFEGDWTKYLDALETANPRIRALGITDYCVTRSYEQLKEFKDAGRLPDCDLIFPNIELRLNTGTVKGRFVNIHLLVCPDDPNHLSELHRFLAQLSFKAFDDKFVCTKDDLIRLGRKADPKLTQAKAALRHGCSQFKVSLDNLLEAHQIAWASENILISVSGNDDGTSGVRDGADTTLREEIEKAAHAIFASSLKQRDFWLGRGASSVEELHDRYDGPKPCIWGCDAHELARVARPDLDKYCWIKGVPTFDTLRQACIDPERAYVGSSPPALVADSQIIDQVRIQNAPWARTPNILLNHGLVAIIGARGSGKTALADIIATGCDAYETSEYPSFLSRAKEHLDDATVQLTWSGGEQTSGFLDSPSNSGPAAFPRARYLSQQFVEELSSVNGMPHLIKEIERVIFESHPTHERDGASDFEELLDLRARHHRDSREREERALTDISDQIGTELDKSRQVAGVTTLIAEKEKLIARYDADRRKLLPKEKTRPAKRSRT